MIGFLDVLPGHSPSAILGATEAGATVRDGGVHGATWSTVLTDLISGDHLRIDRLEPAQVASARAKGVRVWARVGNQAQVRDAQAAGVDLWLTPLEAAGIHGELAATVLIRLAHESGRPWVIEGLGPLGMAAAVSVGAVGVVLTTSVWMAADSPICPEQRANFSRIRSGRSTVSVRGSREIARPGQPRSDRWWLDPDAATPSAQTAASMVVNDTVNLATVWRHRQAAIEQHLRALQHYNPLQLDPIGTGSPVIQGPMAHVSESPALAADILSAGALPFCALSALDPGQAHRGLVRMADELAGRPWGVGVIGFDVMPHRDAHIDAIIDLGPKGPSAVILAGGSPRLAVSMQERGLNPWLHTPSAALMDIALKRGVHAVVLEGHEAGGHVGALTSAALWEEGLTQAVSGQVRPLVVLAGGVGDPVSAAFAAAMSVPACAHGCRIALQAGTAFFYTHEIVEHGQITAAYQQSALACSNTILVGASVNLPLRRPPHTFTEQAIAQERQWLAEGMALNERRQRVEHHSLGRTRVAAKGIERNPTGSPRYRAVSTRKQRDLGAFTMGQGAVAESRLYTVDQVVQRLSVEALKLLGEVRTRTTTPWVRSVAGAPSQAQSRPASTAQSANIHPHAAIAVVGLGCVLPGALDVATFWSNMLHGVDAVGPIPESRWPTHRYWDPKAGSTGPVKTYSRLAAAIHGFSFDPLHFKIPPNVARTLDPSQQLALVAAEQAVIDAGWLKPSFDKRRAGVVLGNAMGGEYAKSLALRVRFREVLVSLEASGVLDGLAPDERDAVFAQPERHLAQGLPPVEIDSMAGLLSNVVAGRVARWLDWMGGNITVDAACAASLGAVAVAVDWLRTGRCDAVLTGGVDTDLSPETYVGFSRTQALSGTGSTPFSVDADGFIMGEGCAVLALKRLDDAERDGDSVYAVIRGVGQSSDGRGRGITAPRAEGQRLAITRAHEQAGFGAEQLDLIEAHGTGTAVGDLTEVGVLQAYLGEEGKPVWLGSVKSMLGHLKGAAGAAGLLKAVLCTSAAVAVPTLHASPFNPTLGLIKGRIKVPRRPTPLPDYSHGGVSAFGFGGTNFHVALTATRTRHPVSQQFRDQAVPLFQPIRRATWPVDLRVPTLYCFGEDTLESLAEAVQVGRCVRPEDLGERASRLTILVHTACPKSALERAARWLQTWPTEGQLGADICLSIGSPQPVVALVPGQGAQRIEAQEAPGWHPSGAAALADYPVPNTQSSEPIDVHRSMVPIAIAWSSVLQTARVPLAAALGHSLGEIGALVMAGRLTPSNAIRLAEARGQALQSCPVGAMLAVSLPENEARQAAENHHLTLAAINGPKSAVLAGPHIHEALAALTESGVRCRPLTVERAFHTAQMRPAADAFARALSADDFTQGGDVWSCSDAAPHGPDPRIALVEAITAPVRFRDALAALYQSGATTYVELGPGHALTGLVRQTLPNANAFALDPNPGDGGIGLIRAASFLVALGHPNLAKQLPRTLFRIAPASPPLAPTRRPQVGDARLVLPDVAVHPPVPKVSSGAPTVAPTVAPDSVHGAVVQAISEVTGYPIDFLDDQLDLEGELGVDSIRKMEILGLLEDRLGFRSLDADYAALAQIDVQTLVAHIEHRLANPADALERPPEAHLYRWHEQPVTLSSQEVRDGWQRWRSADHEHLHAAIRWAIKQVQTAPKGLVVWADDGPIGQGLAGFARCIGRSESIPVRVVICAADAQATAVQQASWADDVGAELSVRADRVYVRQMTPLTLPTDGLAPEHLWLTGGLAGISEAIVQELAPKRLTVLGRSDPNAEGVRDRAHRDAIQRLQASGIDVRWLTCDLSDASDVAHVVRDVIASSGHPDVVLHGAAVLRDGPIAGSTEADLRAVFGAKIQGLIHLNDALEQDTTWVALSSIVSHVGNTDQALYGAANAAMEALSLKGSKLNLALTAWDSRGMAADDALQRVLRARGITALALSTGAAAVALGIRAAYTHALSGTALVLAQRIPQTDAVPWPLSHIGFSKGPLIGQLSLDPTMAILDDHQVGGRALVPGALWLRAMQALCRQRTPGPCAMLDFTVVVPTFVVRPRTATLRGTPTPSGLRVEIQVDSVTVATARAMVAKQTPPKAPSVSQPATVDASGLYRPQILFPGPSWQVLRQLHIGPATATAILAIDAAP
ncbi:MAG: SDR family oxidoreductase, partial [Rhodobacterales bacterium]|nr:SDR family oxidoreductase [Rhodobacterales bacterium]